MIPILDLTRQYAALKPQIDDALIRVAASGRYILGPEVQAFEAEVARYLGVAHAIGCANGSDALFLAMTALKIGPGDEVITTAMSYIATSEAIARTGATPVFVDVDAESFNLDPGLIEQAITPRTRAILPVHLFGQPAAMAAIAALARRHQLAVIEDCAQAIGAEYQGQKVGSIGDIGCFSFFPSKNLGAFGDGGLITTNDETLAERCRMLRAHGARTRYIHDEPGINSRLDEIQAAILRIKLQHLDTWNAARRAAAQRYTRLLSPLADWVQPPRVSPEGTHVYHQYTIGLRQAGADTRDRLQKQLAEAGVQTMIYYPVALYAQPTHAHLGQSAERFPVCEAYTRQVLSLPMFPEITEAEQQEVVSQLQTALEGRVAVASV